MARNKKIVTIEKGRDLGKRFEITEMSAFDAEIFMMRLLSLTGDNSEGGSFLSSDFDLTGLLLKLNTEEGRELYDQLLNGVEIYPTQGSEVKRAIDKHDIEDYQTLFTLRMEALKLITGF